MVKLAHEWPERRVNQREDKPPALGARLRKTLRLLSGQQPSRPVDAVKGEPAMLRLIGPLAILVVVAIVVCTGLAYLLARQADDFLEAEHRQALAGAVEALQAVSPDL